MEARDVFAQMEGRESPEDELIPPPHSSSSVSPAPSRRNPGESPQPDPEGDEEETLDLEEYEELH
jgi:hypothetical protein